MTTEDVTNVTAVEAADALVGLYRRSLPDETDQSEAVSLVGVLHDRIERLQETILRCASKLDETGNEEPKMVAQVLREDLGFTPTGDACMIITRERHTALKYSETFLEALESAGVDNWEGYGIALSSLEGDEGTVTPDDDS